MIKDEPMFEVIENTEMNEPEDFNIENVAMFTIDYNTNQLIIYFGEDRSAVMELEDEEEAVICDKAMADPNFWATFLGSLSTALKNSGK